MSFRYRKQQGVADYIERAQDGADAAGRYIAGEASESFHKHTVRNTPVDTHALRESIEKKPVIRLSWGWEGGIYSELEYAPHVEYGTGLWGPKHSKYKIEPKTPGGVLAFFARVTTPEGRP